MRLGVGGQWSNIHESGSGLSRDLSLLNVLFMFVFDIILYSAITWYISKVNPGEYGYKQPYNFLFSKSYWLGEEQKQTTSESDLLELF
jgi:ATP-binding cassette, subfamily A (ABC1), member 1